MTGNPDEIASEILAVGYRYTNEYELQDGIAARLTQSGREVEREVEIPGGRIDLIVDQVVGVEVKTNGSRASVESQLRRYASGGGVEYLLLVTTRLTHTRVRVPGVSVVPLTLGRLS